MSSEPRPTGRAKGERGALEAAVAAAERALALIAGDDEATYLLNSERQLAIERLLIRFGEALKDVSAKTLLDVDANANWAGPKGFRDLAAHWYEEGLDHALIWRTLMHDLPPMVDAIRRWLSSETSLDKT